MKNRETSRSQSNINEHTAGNSRSYQVQWPTIILSMAVFWNVTPCRLVES